MTIFFKCWKMVALVVPVSWIRPTDYFPSPAACDLAQCEYSLKNIPLLERTASIVIT